MILTKPCTIIPDHHYLSVPGTGPGCYQVDTEEPVIMVLFYSLREKENYFLRMPVAASRNAPIAARMVAIPTGAFCVIPVATGAAGITVPEAGACVGSVIATDVVPAAGWIQWYCTIASALCPQTVLLHISYPFTPHLAMAALSDIHSHGAVQTGASTPDVTWVSAPTPTPAALAEPHRTAAIPRITTILTKRCTIIPDHHYPAAPVRSPGLHDGE